MRIGTVSPYQSGKSGTSPALDDPIFFDLAKFHIMQNYYRTVFNRGSLCEMREDKEAIPLLLFVDIDGLEDIIEKKPGEFRHITQDKLADIIFREANPEGFYDEHDVYHNPSDGGYYVKKHDEGLLLSYHKHIVAHQDRAVKKYNGRNKTSPLVGDDAFEQLMNLYLPADFSMLNGGERVIGGRTQGALAAALAGTEKSTTYILKQTVYDGVMGKLCRFGHEGLETEFFLNALSPGADIAQEESFHPFVPVAGVLRVYENGDPKRREEYHITPHDLGIGAPQVDRA